MGLLDNLVPKPPPAAPPETIDLTPQNEIRIAWEGGKVATIPARNLRDACPCAGCVEEFTGKKILDTAAIPADIRPLQIDPVGSYAIQIRWSDGHSTGIYTWDTLRKASDL